MVELLYLATAALVTSASVALLAVAASRLGAAAEVLGRVRISGSPDAVRALDAEVAALSRSVESRHRR